MSLDVYLEELQPVYVYSSNITHNLGRMAGEAGIYEHLWEPEKLNITLAEQLISPLTLALEKMRDEPEHFKTFEPPNGWGTYDNFINWLEDYLTACINNPKTKVKVSR